jgi:hypothetical protein
MLAPENETEVYPFDRGRRLSFHHSPLKEGMNKTIRRAQMTPVMMERPRLRWNAQSNKLKSWSRDTQIMTSKMNEINRIPIEGRFLFSAVLPT